MFWPIIIKLKLPPPAQDALAHLHHYEPPNTFQAHLYLSQRWVVIHPMQHIAKTPEPHPVMQGVHLRGCWVRGQKSGQSFTELPIKPLIQALGPCTKEAVPCSDWPLIGRQASPRKTPLLQWWGPCWCGSTHAPGRGLCSDAEIAFHVLSVSTGWHNRLRYEIVQPNRARQKTHALNTPLRRKIEGRKHQQDSPPANGNEKNAYLKFYPSLFVWVLISSYAILCNLKKHSSFLIISLLVSRFPDNIAILGSDRYNRYKVIPPLLILV
jgi:hypothetical protein